VTEGACLEQATGDYQNTREHKISAELSEWVTPLEEEKQRGWDTSLQKEGPIFIESAERTKRPRVKKQEKAGPIMRNLIQTFGRKKGRKERPGKNRTYSWSDVSVKRQFTLQQCSASGEKRSLAWEKSKTDFVRVGTIQREGWLLCLEKEETFWINLRKKDRPQNSQVVWIPRKGH